MKRLVLCALFSVGCLPVMPSNMHIASMCHADSLTVQIESPAMDCHAALTALLGYRAEYTARFGDIGPILVRVRDTVDLGTVDGEEDFQVGGKTFQDSLIDVTRDCLECLPHEMHHIARGAGHGGWCTDGFSEWSKTAMGWNQDAYLHCTPK